MLMAPVSNSAAVKPIVQSERRTFSHEYTAWHWFNKLRKSTLLMLKPNSQSRLRCCSIRRVMIRTHSGSGTRGAPGCRRCCGVEDQSGMSGMPVQNSERKTKATPKYHGTNCCSMRLPLATTKRCMCALLVPCRLQNVCVTESASGVPSPAVVHQCPAKEAVHLKRRSEAGSKKPAARSMIVLETSVPVSLSTSSACCSAESRYFFTPLVASNFFTSSRS